MTAQARFTKFSNGFAKALKRQTGLSLAKYSALVLAGQNPGMPSDAYKFCKRLIKRRRKGKKIKSREVDELLDLVDEYLRYQYLTGSQRVIYGRNVINKIIPSLTTVDLDQVTQHDVSGLVVDDEFKKQVQDIVKNEI